MESTKKDSLLQSSLPFIIFTEALGLLSALLSGNIPAVYNSLNKPPLSPPNTVFPIVWVILFALMGYSLYQIWQYRGQERCKAISLFSAQLFVNFIWPIVFFRFLQLRIAFVLIVVLDILVVLTMISFRKIDKKASFLLIPYLIWLLFATYLNLGTALLY